MPKLQILDSETLKVSDSLQYHDKIRFNTHKIPPENSKIVNIVTRCIEVCWERTSAKMNSDGSFLGSGI